MILDHEIICPECGDSTISQTRVLNIEHMCPSRCCRILTNLKKEVTMGIYEFKDFYPKDNISLFKIIVEKKGNEFNYYFRPRLSHIPSSLFSK